jgi:hypothetical protein
MNVWERVHAMVISVSCCLQGLVFVLLRSFFTPHFFGKTQEVPLEDAEGGG